jgi:hypothetical protein
LTCKPHGARSYRTGSCYSTSLRRPCTSSRTTVGDPHARSRHEWSSPNPRLVASLSPILLGKLRPCNFEWWGMPVPGAVCDAAERARSETSCTSNVDIGQQLPAWEVRSATPAVSPPERFPCAEAARQLLQPPSFHARAYPSLLSQRYRIGSPRRSRFVLWLRTPSASRKLNRDLITHLWRLCQPL